jgi:F-type H+-transporting ATPase subunit alpha
LYALTHGYLDKVELDDIAKFESGLFDFFDASHADLLEEIAKTGQLPDTDKMDAAVTEFASTFQPAEAAADK